jgi:hypothetical protein
VTFCGRLTYTREELGRGGNREQSPAEHSSRSAPDRIQKIIDEISSDASLYSAMGNDCAGIRVCPIKYGRWINPIGPPNIATGSVNLKSYREEAPKRYFELGDE